MKDVTEKSIKLGAFTDRITSDIGQGEHKSYNTTREALLGDLCYFLSDAIEEIVITMATKACRVSLSWFKVLVGQQKEK